MTKPISDEAEITLQFPDKLYIGTFGQTSRFDAHLDSTGVSLSLESPGDVDARKSVQLHIPFELFADILRELAKQVPGLPCSADRGDLRDAATVLYDALATVSGADHSPRMTEEEGELILRLME